VTLEESARLAGGHRWVEARLFEVLGGWVPTTGETSARLLLDRHSQHCAWRAAQWWDRLPVLADVQREALCVPPSPAVSDAIDGLRALEGTVARLAGAYRVALPRLWVAYDRHAAAAEAADGSSGRTLSIVSADVAADWREGEAALQALIGGPEDAAAAAGPVAQLEGRLAGG